MGASVSTTGFAARFITLLLLAVLPSPCRAEDLQDAWAEALGTNHALQASQLGTAAAQRGIMAARAERLPTLTTTNAYTWLDNTPTFRSSLPLPGSPRPLTINLPFLNREFFFSSTLANVPLYTGGRTLAGIDAATAQTRAAHAQEVTAAMDLKLDVAQAYLNVLRGEKFVLLSRASVTSLRAHERDVTNLFREGIARRTDLLASQVSLARAQQRVIQTTNELETARAAYNRLLGRPLTSLTPLQEMALKNDFSLDGGGGRGERAADGSGAKPGQLPEALPDASLRLDSPPGPAQEAEIERLTAAAFQGRPELLGFVHQAQQFAAQARAAESLKKPQVAVVGGFTHISDTHLASQDYWSGTIGATWLLCDAGRANRRAEALRLRESQALKERDDAAARIALGVRSNWLSLQSSRAALAVARKAIAQADENLRQIRSRYREQVATNTEVLDAETLRTQIYTDYYNAFYAVLLDQFRLRRSAGML
ncbi:MAG: TolC family protein [Isosphaeraceae bacterium]